LEKKLDVPRSGEWLSEAIFAIRQGEDEHACPGLLFFECTPVAGQDDIEQ
jgi:nuclear mRNA export protein SAC3